MTSHPSAEGHALRSGALGLDRRPRDPVAPGPLPTATPVFLRSSVVHCNSMEPELAGAPGGETIKFLIRAEAEDSRLYQWQDHHPVIKPLRALAKKWAAAYGVPLTAVGFADAHGQKLDLGMAPVGLGWAAGDEPVKLIAFPTEEQFTEQEGEAASGSPMSSAASDTSNSFPEAIMEEVKSTVRTTVPGVVVIKTRFMPAIEARQKGTITRGGEPSGKTTTPGAVTVKTRFKPASKAYEQVKTRVKPATKAYKKELAKANCKKKGIKDHDAE